ncbi:phage shock protein operon transcriptional activator [Sandaracinobacter sp. RS1-74]|uniref:phage shock protein operon transcriptional activator n=1 Tax=Sandaracinobacteroides sayramensis TaxID=2913411 RepID=UPI001EDAB47C|nr:phage shock protein operon transcriptional activator [Sandaracinobacteroides sayramensis]MCG2840102.1 phage shock protein operon transcriptional activator [Sandaracinobacteroides sayramensis]
MPEKPTQLIGQSGPFLDAVERASAAAPLSRPVLVVGERGTGKEMIAERLHRLSPRWEEPLVSLNCAALPETLLDAELFGYEAGAFTGAVRARAGRFEEADGGTLFLDEVGMLTAAGQERLLRVVEYGELARLGSTRVIRVDVRVVAATNEDLPRLAEQGKFRADLLDRLSFEVITLPPLRARREDIRPLADFFGRRMASELGWNRFPGFSARVLEELEAHDWPGNVRELKNAVERAVYRWGEAERPIGALDLNPFESPWRPTGAFTRPSSAMALPLPETNSPAEAEKPETETPLPSDFRGAIALYERKLLEQALGASRHNQRRAAQMLGLSYDQLRHAMKRHNLLQG